MPLSPGTLLLADRYEVSQLIGRGGMADVFAGVDRRLDRPVAIKCLRADMAARDDIRTRFEAEARTAARLSHPNAVAVFDTGEHEGVPYIVMERLPGETLADRMAAGPVDPEWLRTVGVEVLGALAAAHTSGIVHRDVKPGNILMAADGRAKIADFGIAKSLEAGAQSDLTGTGQWVGTPAYLAPERLDGAPATARSDLYSLGVVLYEALAGVKPFTGNSPVAAAHAIAEGRHRPLDEVRPDLDPALVATVERAMATQPGQRFSSADEMSRALLRPAHVAATEVVPPPPDATEVLDDRLRAPGASGDSSTDTDVADALRGRWRRVRVWAVIGLLALVMMFVLVRTADRSQPTSAGSDPPADAASPAALLAQKLRGQSALLSPADGSAAAEAAQRLEEVARRVEAGQGGPEATALLARVAGWNRDGALSDQAAAAIVTLLRQVPGVDPAAATPPRAATPTPTSPRTQSQADGEVDDGQTGKTKKGDDDGEGGRGGKGGD